MTGHVSAKEVRMSIPPNPSPPPVGAPLPEWRPRPRPQRRTLEGRYCRLEALEAKRHAGDLFAAYGQATDEHDWTYLFHGPFDDVAQYFAHIDTASAGNDPLYYAVIDRATGRAIGSLSLTRIDPANGVIEVGHVLFSPALKRTPLSTEAQYLLMNYVFTELGYRRYEWKCDSLNAPSRQAAERLGFQFEGIFRQAVVYKQRTRDTAWFSIIDGEWPALRIAFEDWLAPENFDAQGRQRHSLTAIRKSRAAA